MVADFRVECSINLCRVGTCFGARSFALAPVEGRNVKSEREAGTDFVDANSSRCGVPWTRPDEAPIVIYHSHTATEAYPSRTDISYASEPDAHYVLVSTRDPDEHELRSYRIVDGVVTEEPVNIVEQY